MNNLFSYLEILIDTYKGGTAIVGFTFVGGMVFKELVFGLQCFVDHLFGINITLTTVDHRNVT